MTAATASAGSSRSASSAPSGSRSRCSRHSRSRRSRAKRPRAVALPSRVGGLPLVAGVVEHRAGQLAVVRPGPPVEVVAAHAGPDVVDHADLRVHVDRVAGVVLHVEHVHPVRCGPLAQRQRLLAPDHVRRQRQPAVHVRVAGDDGDQVQVRVVPQRVREQVRDLGRPEVLVLQVDESAGAAYRLGVTPGHGPLAVGCERVARADGGVGAQHLDLVRTAGRRIGRLLGQRVGAQVRAAQPVPQVGHRVLRVQRHRVGPAFPEQGVQRADHRTAHRELHVVPGRVGPVPGGHLHRLRVAVVSGVVAAAVAQVDPAGEGDVPLGRALVPQHHELLVVRAAAPDPLVEQHLAAGGRDRLAEVAVLRLAVRQDVEVRAPDQPLDHHTALRGLRRRAGPRSDRPGAAAGPGRPASR